MMCDVSPLTIMLAEELKELGVSAADLARGKTIKNLPLLKRRKVGASPPMPSCPEGDGRGSKGSHAWEMLS